MVARSHETVEEVARHVLAKIGDRNVVIGPLVWQPGDDGGGKVWYFVVATAGEDREFRCDQILVQDESDRRAVIAKLLSTGRPLVAHTTDDELYFVKLCELLWPGPRIARIRAEVEAARGL